MIKFLEKLLNWIYIERCYFCHDDKEGKRLCSKCKSEIKILPAQPSAVFMGCNIFSVSIYEGTMRELIKRVKYKHDKKLAKEQAEFMVNYWKKLGFFENFVVVPVPQHKNRLKKRGGNHMDLVGQEFCSAFGYRLLDDFVVRIKDTKPQYKLSKEEREKNLKDAFSVDETKLPDKSAPILVIDDIKTTGTTLREIITTLQNKGYTKISALTTART